MAKIDPNYDNDKKISAFDTIMVNVVNEKLSDAEFRAFIKHIWGDAITTPTDEADN